jgi:hypothetical protein
MLSIYNRLNRSPFHPVFRLFIISSVFFFTILSCNLLFASQLEIKFDPSPDPRAIGHYFYYGQTTSFSKKIDLKNNTTYIASNLQEGTTYYFAATAYDIYGNESGFSEILSQQIPPKNQDTDDTEKTDTDDKTGMLEVMEDFQNYLVGGDPPDWFDTMANNSMVEDDNIFQVFNINKNNVFGTTSTQKNIHSHHIKAYIDNLSSLEYTGRMMMTHPDSGIGVTFLSHYPFTDTYYRLRCTKSHLSFHLAPHPHATAMVFGLTDTGVIPKPNEWYRFRIKVQDTGTQTEILAKVWPENASEPSRWQIDAYDDTSKRLTSGTIGVWGGRAGNKYWDDLKVTGN